MADGPLKTALAGFALARVLFDATRTPPASPRIVAPRKPTSPRAAPPAVPTQRLFGVSVADMTRAEVVARIVDWAGRPPARIVVACNLDHVLTLRDDSAFRAVYARADLVTADGMPFVWLSRREGRPLRERVTGASLILPVAKAAARAGRSVFLFGSTADRLVAAAVALKRAAPGLDICGTLAPPFGSGLDETLHAQHLAVLRAARPDIVMVALGTPTQELWSARMADALGTGVFLNVGAGLDTIAGDEPRAPRVARDAGLAWAWRAVSRSRRLGAGSARVAAALPALYTLHQRDLAEIAARRLRMEMAAESEAALRKGAAGGDP